MIPVPNEICRPFLPTRDLAQSRAFYEALGFKKLLDGDVVIFGVDSTSFILQARYEPDWVENTSCRHATSQIGSRTHPAGTLRARLGREHDDAVDGE